MKILCVKEIYGSPCFLKFTLHLVWISSLVLSPCGGLKVPILIIHLSSMSFSLWHSEHLQATPPPWPTSASFSSEVTIESRLDAAHLQCFGGWDTHHRNVCRGLYWSYSRPDKLSLFHSSDCTHHRCSPHTAADRLYPWPDTQTIGTSSFDLQVNGYFFHG